MRPPGSKPDTNENMARDLVVVGHKADQVPAGAVGDMNNRNAGHGGDQPVECRRHVQASPVREIRFE